MDEGMGYDDPRRKGRKRGTGPKFIGHDIFLQTVLLDAFHISGLSNGYQSIRQP